MYNFSSLPIILGAPRWKCKFRVLCDDQKFIGNSVLQGLGLQFGELRAINEFIFSSAATIGIPILAVLCGAKSHNNENLGGMYCCKIIENLVFEV